MFRAVKPGSGAGSAPGGQAEDSERTAVFRAVKPPAPAAPADGEPADSERTAVFRAIKPGTAQPGAANPGTARQGNGTAQPGSANPGAANPGTARQGNGTAQPGSANPGAANPGTARQGNGTANPGPARQGNSTFVPLRSDDVPARPTPGAPPAPGAPRTAAGPAQAPAPGRTPVPGGVRPPAPYESPERTTQQPLPPKPPLDMLADLTNNPPPPPSAARTALRRFKIYAPVLVLLAVILAVVQLVRPLPAPTLKVTANTSYTFEGGAPNLPWPKEGQAYMAAAGLGTVGSFGEQKPVAIGSVAKAMTAYVILKDFPMKKGEEGEMIPVDKQAVEDGKKETEGESTVNNLREGGKISQKDALSAIMIPSANNVARLLARWDGGQEAFVRKMNDTAKELGMTNTTYTDPSGLDATTVSTAEDQVKLGLKIVEMPELIAITRQPSWTDASGKKWRNYNDLVPYNGSLGIKTGSTTKAGGNLLFAAHKEVGKTDQLIVGAVLGQHGVPILGTAIEASKDVMIATQKMLKSVRVIKKGAVVGYVDDGLGTRVPVVATADVEAVGWPTLTISTKLADGAGQLPQTAKAGSEIGMLTVGEGASQVKVPVALQSDLTAPGIGKKLTRVG
ncbi:D-alanyl-D-alanine carboxypeptidase family protein [Streptomyces sp. 5.8]|uniref:D-alanyl-D-alanine carboxypeptidase family protein n=1 Tax=Streptomyces sp. 5.8 TaxID=3406571 RepID=UPI003BB62A70